MKASISVKAVTNEITITIQEVNWEEIQRRGFYEGEAAIRELVKVIGQELTVDLMRSNLVDDELLVLNGKTYYRKDASAGHYQTLYGEVVLSRHLYQTSAEARPSVRWRSIAN